MGARRKKYRRRQRQTAHRDRIIPALSTFSSPPYLIDTDREFTVESVLTRRETVRVLMGAWSAHTLSQPAMFLSTLLKAHAGYLSTAHRGKHK